MIRTLFRLAMLVSVSASPLTLHAQGGAAAVGVQTVQTQELSETVVVFAEVVTARNGAVASRVAGSVDQIDVLVGTTVQEGDVLVELNRELLAIQVRQARARISEADASVDTNRARLDNAETSFNRVDALRGSSAFSQGRYDDVLSAVQVARAQLAEAQSRLESGNAELAEAEYQLERSVIRAPFSGVVLEVQTIPGAFIQAGTPVVRILDTESFEVEASIPSRFITPMQPGQMMRASLETGDTLDVEVRAILPVEDPSTRTRAVRFSAPGLGEVANIAVGQSLTVEIPVGAAREVLSVPKDALVQAQGGWTVFVAADGKAQPRQVQIGVPSGDRYEVISGLAPGDQVVVRGNERLRPGQDIAPSPVETN